MKLNRNPFRPFRTYSAGQTIETIRRLPKTAGYVNRLDRITITIGKVEPAEEADTFRVWRAGDEHRPLGYLIISGREGWRLAE